MADFCKIKKEIHRKESVYGTTYSNAFRRCQIEGNCNRSSRALNQKRGVHIDWLIPILRLPNSLSTDLFTNKHRKHDKQEEQN